VKAPLIKVFLARYVLLLEIAGYLALILLIGGIVYSTMYMIDDVCMVNATACVTPRTEIIASDKPAYVREVYAREGELVKAGSPLFSVVDHTREFDELIALRRSFLEAQQVLEATTETLAQFSEISDIVNRGIEATNRLSDAPTSAVTCTLSGELAPISTEAPSLEQLTGQIVEGPVAKVLNYESLRFSVPLSGKNAGRVRISRLAVDDVLGWKALTRSIKAEVAPTSPAEERFWERLKGKLPDIKPNRVPSKNGKEEVVQALNQVLEAPDLYDPTIWPSNQLPGEEAALVRKGLPNLTFGERVRLNRLLIQETFPGVLARSKSTRMAVNARVLVKEPPSSGGEEGQVPEDKVFPMVGKIVSEPQGGRVTIDLPNPDPELLSYLRKRQADPSLPAPDIRGSIVIDRISAFRFLFRKQ